MKLISQRLMCNDDKKVPMDPVGKEHRHELHNKGFSILSTCSVIDFTGRLSAGSLSDRKPKQNSTTDETFQLSRASKSLFIRTQTFVNWLPELRLLTGNRKTDTFVNWLPELLIHTLSHGIFSTYCYWVTLKRSSEDLHLCHCK